MTCPRWTRALCATVAALALAGCGEDDHAAAAMDASDADHNTAVLVGTPAPPAPARAPEPAKADAAADPDLAIVTVSMIDFDGGLATLCGLAGNDVFFKYDSAKVAPEVQGRLDRIAACATTGPAKGKELIVVGRADPVGTDAYNKDLGMSRADSVAKYLREKGVATSRVETESKGEAAAAENLPVSWPYERRVTVRLAD